MIAQYRAYVLGLLAAAALAIAAWAGWQANGWRLGNQLATAEAAHQHALGKITRAAAAQLQAQQTQRLALEQRLAELDTTHQQEITHAQAAADQLATDLAAARSRLSVRINPATCPGGLPAATSATGLDDAAGARADLHPATAAGIVRVTGRADQCRARLTALQAWVGEVTAER